MFKTKELRLKSKEELGKILVEKRERMRELRFKISSKQHKSHQDLRKTRKEIAMIMTIVREKDLLGETSNRDKKLAGNK